MITKASRNKGQLISDLLGKIDKPNITKFSMPSSKDKMAFRFCSNLPIVYKIHSVVHQF